MTRVGAGILLGACFGLASIGACALDEVGTSSDGSALDVTTDVAFDGGSDAIQDVTYDIPDLGAGETESGLPCTCVPTPPTGYTVVEYVPDQRPSCTAGYDPTPKDYIEGTGAPAQCSCMCTSTPASASCACGNNPASFVISSGNTDCAIATNQNVVANAGSCYTTAQPLMPGGNKLNMMQAALGNNACSATATCAQVVKNQNIPDASVEQGRACTLDAATTSCGGGTTCVPNQGGPFSMCITNGSMAQCPNGFPIPHVVGTGPNDTRGCTGTCSCNLVDAGTCGVPQLTLYETDTNCGTTGSSVSMPVDDSTCVSAGYNGGTTFASAKYTIAHSGGACGLSGSSTPTGNFALAGAFRVCCR